MALRTPRAAWAVLFVPSLFVGVFLGAVTALCATSLGWHLSLVSFTLVGMAGVMSGVMNAPLTSIFLIAELSNGYELFIPLMITSCISFALNYYLDPDSIYASSCAGAARLLTTNKDQSAFVFLRLEDLMETDFLRIRETSRWATSCSSSPRRAATSSPSSTTSGGSSASCSLDDLREDMFKARNTARPSANT